MYPGAHAKQLPGKPAVIMAGSGEVLTYRDLDERSARSGLSITAVNRHLAPPEISYVVSDAGAAVLIDFCRGTPAYTHREACQDKAARTVPVIHTVLNEEWWSCRSEPRCCAPRMGLT